MRIRRILTVVLFLLAACRSDAASNATAVPFKLDPVKPPPQPGGEELAPATTPSCTAADLVADGPGDVDHLPMPPQAGALVLTIQAPDSEGCALDRWPTVAFNDSPLPDNGWDADRPAVLLGGRRQVIGFVHLPTSCADGGELVLGYPDGTSSPYTAPAPGCGAGMSPNDVVSGWMTWNEDPPDTPFDSLTLELDDLPKVIKGHVLRATLVLGNPTDREIPLEPCPGYSFGYGESGTSVSIDSRFNCDAAPDAVPAGGNIRFTIELPLPKDDVPDGFHGSVGASLHDDDRKPAATRSDTVVVED